MLDPISALNAIGFAFQAIDLLIRSASQVRKRFRLAQDCAAQLRSYKSELETCQISMQEFSSIWGGFDDATYEDFWTRAAFLHIRSQAEALVNLHESIQNQVLGRNVRKLQKSPDRLQRLKTGVSGHLNPIGRWRRSSSASSIADDRQYEPSQPEETDWDKWKKLSQSAEQKSSRSKPQDTEDIDLLFKIAFALYKSEELEEKVKRLKELTEELHNYSRQKYLHLRGQDSGTRLSRKDLKSFMRFKVRLRTIDLFT